MRGYPSTKTVIELRRQLRVALIHNWQHETFLHWEWWFLITLLFLPWFIWWKLVEKQRLNLIFQFGLIVLILNAFLDDLGSGLLWWFYPHKIIPTLHVLKSPSLSIVPCLMMIVFQYCHTWKKFLIGNLLGSLVFSFMGEPLFMAIGIYKLITWNPFYSFLFYNFEGLIARWVVLKVNNISLKKNKA